MERGRKGAGKTREGSGCQRIPATRPLPIASHGTRPFLSDPSGRTAAGGLRRAGVSLSWSARCRAGGLLLLACVMLAAGGCGGAGDARGRAAPSRPTPAPTSPNPIALDFRPTALLARLIRPDGRGLPQPGVPGPPRPGRHLRGRGLPARLFRPGRDHRGGGRRHGSDPPRPGGQDHGAAPRAQSKRPTCSNRTGRGIPGRDTAPTSPCLPRGRGAMPGRPLR